MLLGELGPPHKYEQPRFESETADEVPEGWKAQVLHEFAPDAELEVNGEEKEVPNEIHSDSGEGQTLGERMVLCNLLDLAKHDEERNHNAHGCCEGIVGNLLHVDVERLRIEHDGDFAWELPGILPGVVLVLKSELNALVK